MATSNGEDQDDQKQWETVLSGEHLPVEHSSAEQEADALRQVLIWRNAKQMNTQHTPEDAAAFYQHLQGIQRQRKRARILRWAKIVISSILVFVIAASVWFYLEGRGTDVTPTVESTGKKITTQAPQQGAIKILPLMPELVSIPAGEFVMGCTAGWDDAVGGCRTNEFPAHTVEVAAFSMGRYEVTMGQFKHFVSETNYQTVAEQNNQGCSVLDPNNPSQWMMVPANNWRNPGFTQTDSHPVVCLSWQDTQYYVSWLTDKTNQQYRLPSESEWEYAARAGRVTAFYWGSKGDRRFANYQGTATHDSWLNTAPVGLHSSNKFGLHDMAGNAWEWTASCWRESYQTPELSNENCTSKLRSRRGGGWDNNPPSIRSAYRSSGNEVERSNLYGFRVVTDH
ncbi:formylglycine-generating enzyme family protein [Leucothrix arctica]|uniref:Sulfatase-modifying factor enzyme-like domain-containing protein n=1 Tax=Leucothrix arctica TaxID=1481894 RepID=A0A317CBG7_9GAMM|nr:formylglycine-generating enzyme family protein [Leucothrix arctica]PWQ95707.1 hypothetical protein DKT75_11780 [Leucothrix arctica]